MGREIVYCWKCATRLQGADFDSGNAYRHGDKVSCPNCIDDLICDLSAEEQEAILSGNNSAAEPRKKPSSSRIKAPTPERGTSTRKATGAIQKTTGSVQKARPTTSRVPMAQGTRVTKKTTASIPKIQPPVEDEEMSDEDIDEKAARKKKLILWSSVAGGFLVLFGVLLVVLFSGNGGKKGGTEAGGKETATKPLLLVPKTTTETPAEQAARIAMTEAKNYLQTNPEEFAGLMTRFRAWEKASEGTSYAADAAEHVQAIQGKIIKAIDALKSEANKHIQSGDYKAAFDVWEREKDKFDISEWKEPVKTQQELTKSIVDDKFRQLRRRAKDAKEANDAAALQECKETVKKWDIAQYIEDLDKALASADAPSDATPPSPGGPKAVKLSPEMQAFMPGWQKAIAIALNRDYDNAIEEMGRAAKAVDSAEVRKAGEADQAIFRQLASMLPEILKTAAEAPRNIAVTLEYQHAPGDWKKVTGKLLKGELLRLEIQPDPKDAKAPLPPPMFIEVGDLSGGSLGTLYLAKKKTLQKKESQAFAYLCLIEGQLEAAKAHTVGAGPIPERFWTTAEMRASAPRPDRKEFEARNLVHQAEFEWRKMNTWGNAIEKYKALLANYSSTAVFKRSAPLIAKRSEVGREYVYYPSDLRATGDNNTFKLAKKEADEAWITSKDIDFQESLHNYIEVEFFPLPGLTYRAWAYVGGCCQQVCGGSYQASEVMVKNKNQNQTIDPGSTLADPLPMPGGLKKTHEDHKPKNVKDKDHLKQPTKWDWISLKMPKAFAQPGSKSIRLLTDQAGYGVKFIIVSAIREKSPNEQTAKDMAKEAASAGAEPAAGPKGTPDPVEWLVVGPFADGIDNAYPPEKDINLAAELNGKSGKIKWKTVKPELRPAGDGKAAVFDFDKMFNPKTQCNAYVLIHVKAPTALDARLWLGRDDDIKVWVNNEQVYRKTGGAAGLKVDGEQAVIKLADGWNRILVKVRNNADAWAASVRLGDASKKSLAGLEYHPYGDALDPQ